MSIQTIAHDLWLAIHHLITARDIVEIIFFSTLFYTLSRWLRNDCYKNLLGYFWGYCGLGLIVYMLQLPTILYCMCLFSPILIMLFILAHQHTLQKNFIALASITTISQQKSNDWLAAIIRSSLIAINHNKAMLCIIEHTESIAEIMHTLVTLEAPITDDLLTIIVDCPSYNQDQLLWINTQGTIRGFNAYWRQSSEEQWISPHTQSIEPWQQEALFFTSKYNALCFQITPAKRTFDIIVQGKLYTGITTAHVLSFIKKYLHTQESQGEFTYVSQSKKHTTHQHST